MKKIQAELAIKFSKDLKNSLQAKEKFVRCFKLYKDVKFELEHYVNMRGNRHSISVNKDEYAVKWQGKQMRLELLESFLEDRNPNWYCAHYLDNAEKDKRNKTML